MAVELIAENILSKSKFLSATEQEGPYIGQPVPGSGNTGNIRLHSGGDIADFTYSGTVTNDGSTTTIIDSKLSIYGDDYFISGTIEFTGGENSSGTKTISDFTGATGTITWVGALNSTLVGDTFTLTVSFKSREFIAELIASGDIGTATFKWTHDGTTYLGRDDPNQADWENKVVIADALKLNSYPGVAYNPDSKAITVVYQDDNDANDAAVSKTSTNRGIAWASAVNITGTSSGVPYCSCILSSGRHLAVIYVGGSTFDIYYSDNDGGSWAELVSNLGVTVYDIMEMASGVIGIVYNTGTYNVYYAESYDGGKTFVNSILIVTDITTWGTGVAKITQAQNGDYLVAVSTDKYHAGDFQIKIFRSTNKGAAWAALSEPFYDAGVDYYHPGIIRDINGDIYVCCTKIATDIIYLKKSTDDCVSFGAAVALLTDTVNDPRSHAWTVIGPEIVIVAQGEGGWGANLVVNGDMEIQTGGAGTLPDNWTVEGTPTTAERSDTPAHGGMYSAKIVADAAGEGLYCDDYTTVTGTWYKIKIYIFPVSGGDDSFRIEVRRGDDGGDLYSADHNDLPADQWNEIDLELQEVSGGVNAHVKVEIRAAGTYYVDDVEVQALGGALLSLRRGMWEAYSANACPCSIWADIQQLICDVGIIWRGYAGVVGDTWSWETEYYFGMQNLISHSPEKPWRSTQDNIACNIVIDLGANERFQVTGVGFFNSNVRTLDFQMNATNAWGGPSVDEAVSFDLVTGTVDAVSGNAIQDTSLLAGYKDHELKASKHFLRMTSGVDDTVTWEILDNVGNYILLDTTAAINVAGSDTFVIFQDHIAKTFTGGIYRFINVAIAAQHTADDYYQFGMVVMGRSITLTRGFGVGYSKDHKYDIKMLRGPKGGMVPIKGRARKRIFSLSWPATEETRQEVSALLDYIEGKNIVLIPDSSDLKDCYLVKHVGDLRQKHRFVNRMDQGPVMFEEV